VLITTWSTPTLPVTQVTASTRSAGWHTANSSARPSSTPVSTSRITSTTLRLALRAHYAGSHAQPGGCVGGVRDAGAAAVRVRGAARAGPGEGPLPLGAAVSGSGETPPAV